MRRLCRMILDNRLTHSRRAWVLKEAFVWADAPKRQFFWHKQWQRLSNGRELTGEARDALKSFNSVRHSETVRGVLNPQGKLKQFYTFEK